MNLSENNLIKYNKKIDKLKKDKIRCDKIAGICKLMFGPLAYGHVIVALICDVVTVIPATMKGMMPPIITPSMIFVVSSCVISLGLTTMIQIYNENNSEKKKELIMVYESNRTEYMKKIEKKSINFKNRCKNIRKKGDFVNYSVIDQYVEPFDLSYKNGQSLLLKK